MAHGYQKNGALAFGVGREKTGHFVVEKSEAGGAQPLGVGRQVQLAAKNAGFQLHGAVAAIAEAPQNRPQVRQKKYVHGRVGGQLLLQSKVSGLGTKISLLQALQRAVVAVENVCPGRKTFDRMNNQVEVIELRPRWIKEIRRDAPSGAV